MDPTSAYGSGTDVGAIYATAMVKRTQDQTRVEGQAALRLIESATTALPMPPDATISLRA